jgi:hypothetical protein
MPAQPLNELLKQAERLRADMRLLAWESERVMKEIDMALQGRRTEERSLPIERPVRPPAERLPPLE